MNHKIRAPEVRCIDVDGNQIGVITAREARSLAQRKGLDLVEVSPNANPPVCRIMDYGKYKYEQGKKQRIAKKHHSTVKLKEIKFHANCETHDFQTKMRHAREFLDHGHRIKFSLYFRGREGAHKDLGFELMNRVADELKDIANIDQATKAMGRSIFMMVSPSKNVKKTDKGEEDPGQKPNEETAKASPEKA